MILARDRALPMAHWFLASAFWGYSSKWSSWERVWKKCNRFFIVLFAGVPKEKTPRPMWGCRSLHPAQISVSGCRFQRFWQIYSKANIKREKMAICKKWVTRTHQIHSILLNQLLDMLHIGNYWAAMRPGSTRPHGCFETHAMKTTYAKSWYIKTQDSSYTGFNLACKLSSDFLSNRMNPYVS